MAEAPSLDHLQTIPQYAKERNTTRLRIYNLISAGKIVPIVISDKQFIDVSVYGNYDVHARTKREESIERLKKQLKTLREDFNYIRNIVLAENPDGRSRIGMDKSIGQRLSALEQVVFPEENSEPKSNGANANQAQ